MEKVQKVLQINAWSKTFGGVSSILYDIYKYIDKNKVQFDFLSPHITTYEIIREEIENMGGKIFQLNCGNTYFKKNILLFKRLNKFLIDNKYDIIHINSGAFFFNLQVAIVAKKNKVKTIIVHSHNTLDESKKIKNLLIKLCKPLLNLFCTDYFACSMAAGQSLFTRKILKSNKFKVIKNGIKTENFMYNIYIRNKYREELNLTDKFVIGHIGRFEKQKNHDYLIDIFYEVYKKRPESILVLIGAGTNQNTIMEKVKKLGIEKAVLFMGLRKDVNNLLQAFDCFVFPSLFEGFGIVAIEAQAVGLPCFVSTNLPNEVKITDNIEFISIKDSPSVWSDKILEGKIQNEKSECYKLVYNNGYDISSVAKELEIFYIEKE